MENNKMFISSEYSLLNVNELKSSLNEYYDLIINKLDINSQKILIKFDQNCEYQDDGNKNQRQEILNNYIFLVNQIQIIIDSNLKEIDDYLLNSNISSFYIYGENYEILKEKILSKNCIYFSNDELNYFHSEKNPIGLFISFDWYLSENESNFLRKRFGREKNVKNFYFDKNIINLIIALQICNYDNSLFKNIIELKKNDVNNWAYELIVFNLTNDEYDQNNFLIKSNTFENLKNTKILRLNFSDYSLIEFEDPDEFFNVLTNIRVEQLFLSYNRIKNISAVKFWKLKYLKKLELKYNGIKLINQETFMDLGNLQVLDLQHNLIKKLNKNSFVGLNVLKYLDLSNCEIENIEDDCFRAIANLKLLNLSSNPFEIITRDTFNGLENLLELHLSDNNLKILDDECFANLKNLRYLDFTNRNLQQLKLFKKFYRKDYASKLNFQRLGLFNNNIIKTNF